MVFKCPNCGGDMQYVAGTSTLKCDHCDTGYTVSEFKAIKEARHVRNTKAAEEEPLKYLSVNELTCSRCGATLYTTDNTVATFCSYCGSSTLLESKVSYEKRPDLVIPFSRTKEEAVRRYKAYVRRNPFAPRWLTEEAEVDRFRGIYMPYWVYSFSRRGKIRTTGERKHSGLKYEYTDHYLLDRFLDADINGLNFDAAMDFSDNLSSAIAPFAYKDAVPFQENYLSGFYADNNDVSADIYEDEARSMAKDYIVSQIPDKARYRSYGISEQDLARAADLRARTEKGLFPVWFLSARPKDREKVCYAAINGQTGKVAADLPIDLGRFLVGALLLAVPIFLLLSFTDPIHPDDTLLLCLLLSVISIVVSCRQLRLIYVRKHRLDDAGYLGTESIYYQSLLTKKDLVLDRNRLGTTGCTGCLLILVLLVLVPIIPVLIEEPYMLLVMLLPVGYIGLLLLLLSFLKKRRKQRKTVRVTSQGEKIDIPRDELRALTLKPAMAIVLSLVILYLDPVSDVYYYAAASTDLLMIAWSFLDIVKGFNELTMRELPQFEYRGGDHYD